MTKNDGLDFLLKNYFPTIKLLTLEDLQKDKSFLEQGISVRLSSKTDNIDVNLKSIHNVHDLETIIKFIKENIQEYNIIIHKTVKPEFIGTISKYNNFNTDILAIELYNNFEDRKKEIVSYRAIVEMVENRIIRIDNKDFYLQSLFRQIMRNLSDIYLNEYTFEFVVEQGKLIFTDFYSQEYSDMISKKILTKKILTK